MQINFKGEFAQRVRIKVIWFWIVKPWGYTPIDETVTIQTSDLAISREVSGVPVMITARYDSVRREVAVSVTVNGIVRRIGSYPVAQAYRLDVDFEPIKGVRLTGVLTITP